MNLNESGNSHKAKRCVSYVLKAAASHIPQAMGQDAFTEKLVKVVAEGKIDRGLSSSERFAEKLTNGKLPF